MTNQITAKEASAIAKKAPEVHAAMEEAFHAIRSASADGHLFKAMSGIPWDIDCDTRVEVERRLSKLGFDIMRHNGVFTIQWGREYT